MPVSINDFSAFLLPIITAAGGKMVTIEVLYQASISHFTFDNDDLASTILRGRQTSDPNWKRNLRTALKGLKNKGIITHAGAGGYALPNPDQGRMLDGNEAWKIISEAAAKSYAEGEQWLSNKQGKVYQIVSTGKESFSVLRLLEGTIAKVSKMDVERAVTNLNASGGIAARRTLNYTVAKEAAIVHLHPSIIWDVYGDSIMVNRPLGKVSPRAVADAFKEAADDIPGVFQEVARKIRKGQAMLRKNLLKAYRSKCCISGTGPENVLQAAHIEPHAATGVNHSTNGLLLRADLHDLFDDGLLFIDPQTNAVHLHPSLQEGYYAIYQGRTLALRTDGLKPDFKCLAKRWESKAW